MSQGSLFGYSKTYYEIHTYLVDVCSYSNEVAHDYILEACPHVLAHDFVPAPVTSLEYEE